MASVFWQNSDCDKSNTIEYMNVKNIFIRRAVINHGNIAVNDHSLTPAKI